LCHEYYHDIDIVNAHPTLLLQLMERWGYGDSFVELRRLVNHREAIMQEAVSKGWQQENMKKGIIVLMYGGTLAIKAFSDFPWLQNLRHEFIRAADIISKHPDHQTLLKEIAAYKGRRFKPPTSSCKFRLVSCALQEIENAILQASIFFLANGKGLSVEELVLCFDGFMLPKSEMQTVGPEFLKELSTWVKEKTGWSVTFAMKPMDKIMDLTGLEPVFVKGQIVESDVDACKIIQRQLAGGPIAVRADSQVYVKVPLSRKWATNEKALKEALKEYCDIVDLRIRKGEKYSHQACGIRNIITAFPVPEDPMFPSKLHRASLYKIYWEDVVYDFLEGKFREEGPGDMTAARVPRPYPKKPPLDADLEKYKKQIFIDPFGEEVGTFLLKTLARATAGHIEDKRWLVVFGLRNSGKGMVEAALRSALGPDYVVSFNIKALQVKSNTDDADYELKWLNRLRWSRIAISNETIDKLLDSNLSKKLVSGGDPVTVRLPHGLPFSFIPQCTYINNANDLFEASTSDAMETCVVIQSSVKFVTQSEYNAEANPPAFWRVGDPELKVELENPRCGDIIWHLLLRNYDRKAPEVPQCIKMEAAAMKEDNHDDIDNVIEVVFEITGNESDTITSKQMIEAWGPYNAQFNMTKLRHRLKLLNNPAKGVVIKSDNIMWPPDENTHNAETRKKTRVWKGLKIIVKESGIVL
jgi:hypothetical protein